MLQQRVLEHLIARNGLECVFFRPVENKYHEAAGEDEVHQCKGLFHSSGSFLSIDRTDAGKIRTEKEPMLLVLPADVREGDRVKVGDRPYEVTGIDDPGNLGICIDLSLKEVA